MGNVDTCAWNQFFLKHHTVVAEINGNMIGFGDMDDTGYLDRPYVYKDCQAQGVATAIVNELEKQALLHGVSLFTTYAFITAKPFFEKSGYHVACENIVVCSNMELANCKMQKNMVK